MKNNEQIWFTSVLSYTTNVISQLRLMKNLYVYATTKFIKIIGWTALAFGLLLGCKESAVTPTPTVITPVLPEKFVSKNIDLTDIGRFTGYFDSGWRFIPTAFKMDFNDAWNGSKLATGIIEELKTYRYVNRLSTKQSDLLSKSSKLDDLQAFFDTAPAAGLYYGITVLREGVTFATAADSFTKPLSVKEFKNFSLENIGSILVKMNEGLIKKNPDFQIIKISKWSNWNDFIELLGSSPKFDFRIWVTWIPWLEESTYTLAWLRFDLNQIVWYKWPSGETGIQLWSEVYPK